MKGNSSAVYRFRREIRFAKPPAAIWPFVSDTALLWEFNGFAPYQFEERVDALARILFFVNKSSAKLAGIPAAMEENFADRRESRHYFQVRDTGVALSALAWA